MNWELDRYLVKIPTTYSLEGIYWLLNSWWSTLSQIKWRSISICFNRAWKTRLAAKATTLLLSHHINGVTICGMHDSFNNSCTHTISTVGDVSALYSNSSLLQETFFVLMRTRRRDWGCKRDSIPLCYTDHQDMTPNMHFYSNGDQILKMHIVIFHERGYLWGA